jgi:hypothetical protein
VIDDELRAMDVAVHRNVMGEECYLDPHSGEWCQVYDWLTDYDGQPLPVSIPYYSSSWSGAGLVLEKMMSLGWVFRLTPLSARGNSWVVEFSRAHCPPKHGNWPDEPTAPRAICLTALKVVARGAGTVAAAQ